MKTLKTRVSVVLLLPLMIIMFSKAAFGHDLVFPAEKLKILFPAAESFEQKNLYLSDDQRARIEKQTKSRLPEEDLKPSVYLAIVRKTPDSALSKAAVILFVDALGAGGKIEIGIVINGKGELLKVHIFENNESEKLSQQAFLKQFEGKKLTDPFKTGTDITSPAGTENTTQAIASGVQRGLLIISEIFRKK